MLESVMCGIACLRHIMGKEARITEGAADEMPDMREAASLKP